MKIAICTVLLGGFALLSAGCGVSDGPSLLSSPSVVSPTTPVVPTPTPPVSSACASGLYDTGGGVCASVGSGYFSNGDGTRQACSSPPPNAFHSSPNATSDPCPFACNDGYLSNGTTCNSFPFAKLLGCAPGEIAVGFYGQSGSIVDAIGIRCAPYSNGAITGPAVDRTSSYYGGTGGGSFNSSNAQDCPANSYMVEVAGTNCIWQYSGNSWQTAELRYRCKDLSTGVIGSWLPGNPGWGSTDGGSACGTTTTFTYQCGSGANPTGSFINGYIINTNSNAAFVGDGLGIACQ